MATTVLQPGSAAFGLALAGAWAKAALVQLPVARRATSTLDFETFEEFGSGLSTVLAAYLALDHARDVATRTPWIGSWPMDANSLTSLHGRALAFRDFLMHADDKLRRGSPMHDAAARRQAQTDVSPRPYGYVAASLGFEAGRAVLYGPIGRTVERGMTHLGWDEIEVAAGAIASWATDLLSRWEVVKEAWAPYVTLHGHSLH